MNRITSTAILATVLTTLTVSSRARADDDTPAPPATISVRSAYPDVTIGYVTERATAVTNNGTVAMGVAWKDMCTAPCAFKLPSGFHELVATGPGYVGGSERFELRPGTNRFVVKPGSAVVRWGGYLLTTLGLTALVLGVTFAAIGTTSVDSQGNMTKSTPGWAIPAAVAGGVATGGGIAMMFMSSTSIQREGEDRDASRGRFLGVAYSGKW
jgi:hypothetical protein